MTNLSTNPNVVVWFDLPVLDLDRAIQFYSQVLDNKVSKEIFGDFQFAVLDHNDGNGGCLVPTDKPITAENSILVYFSVDGRLKEATSLVEKNGGKIEQDIHEIGPHGLRCLIKDSEGNRIALHSTQSS